SALSVSAGPLSSVATGDFNADGKADLAVTQENSNLVTVLLGKGNGTFQPGTPYVVGNGPGKIIAANLTAATQSILFLLTSFRTLSACWLAMGTAPSVPRSTMFRAICRSALWLLTSTATVRRIWLLPIRRIRISLSRLAKATALLPPRVL